MLTLAVERFERRLSEQMSALRVELAQAIAGVRQEIATGRVEYIRWSFLFWVGQVAAVAALLAVMLRTIAVR